MCQRQMYIYCVLLVHPFKFKMLEICEVCKMIENTSTVARNDGLHGNCGTPTLSVARSLQATTPSSSSILATDKYKLHSCDLKSWLQRDHQCISTT